MEKTLEYSGCKRALKVVGVGDRAEMPESEEAVAIKCPICNAPTVITWPQGAAYYTSLRD